MEIDDLNAATERINAGAEVPSIEPSLVEHLWEIISSIPRELRQNHMSGHLAIADSDPNLFPHNPKERVATMVRYALLDALVERGVLDEYMQDELLRKKVFAAAARFPCDKNDLGEALAQRLACDLPPEAAQKCNEEFRQSGYDPDHPKVGKRFIEWMRDNC